MRFSARLLAVIAAVLIICTASLRGAQSPSTNLEFGNPGGHCTLLDKRYFVVCYDMGRRIPEWVGYRLRRSDLRNAQSRTEDFRPDPDLDEDARSELSDYRSSGFDRGHMAPAADFTRSQLAMSMTFLLSNMTPQRPTLNRAIWARLESQTRNLAKDVGTIWVFTGALFLKQRPNGYTKTIGSGRVAVPTHFYKVILARDASGEFEMHAFVFPNSLTPIRGRPADYVESVDNVEGISGLDFFADLDDDSEDSLERETAPWPY